MKMAISFVAGMLLIMAMDVAMAQQPEVRCESIMYPGTIQIFPGYMCPTNWYPV